MESRESRAAGSRTGAGAGRCRSLRLPGTWHRAARLHRHTAPRPPDPEVAFAKAPALLKAIWGSHPSCWVEMGWDKGTQRPAPCQGARGTPAGGVMDESEA